MSDYVRMLNTAGQVYTAWLTATADVGGRALRAGAAESAQVAGAAAHALRAPDTHRIAATEQVLSDAYDAQTRQLHAMRGLSGLWSMSFLRALDAARHRD